MWYSRSLLFISFIHSSLYLLIQSPNLSHPPLPFPFGNHKFVFYVSESISKQLPFTVVSLKSHLSDQHPVGQNLVQRSHRTPRVVEQCSLSRQPWVWLNHGEFYYQKKWGNEQHFVACTLYQDPLFLPGSTFRFPSLHLAPWCFG